MVVMRLKRSWGSVLLAVALLGVAGTTTAWGRAALPSGVYPAQHLTEPAGTTDVGDHRIYLPLVQNIRFLPKLPSVFGVQLYGTINEERTALNQMREARVYWTRWPVSWAGIEPANTTPEHFSWGIDASVWNAYSMGAEMIMTIHNNPDWAATYANGPIDLADLSEFAQFMGALAERYDGDGYLDAPLSPVVEYFEMYNEPDAGVELRAQSGYGYWGPFGDQYAQMLCAVYPAVKAANPDAQVLLGGIAYDNFLDGFGGGLFVREFLGDVLTAGGGNCFDIANFHYYPAFEANWAPYGPGLSGKASYLRANYGLAGKPMAVTEAGWHSDDYSIWPSSQTVQARYVIKLFTQAMSSDLIGLTWWTWTDPPAGYGPYGLLDTDLQPKLSYYAYQDAAERLGKATFVASVNLGDAVVQAYRFVSPESRPLYVLWSDDETWRPVSLPFDQGQIIDMYGTVLATVYDSDDGHTDGAITVSAGADPRYVESVQ